MNNERFLGAILIRVGRFSTAMPRPVAGAAITISTDPGDLPQLRSVRPSPEYYSRPITARVTETRGYRIRDDVDQSIQEGSVIEYRLCGVATLKEGAVSPADGIDGPGKVSEEVTGPCRQLATGVSEEEMEVIGHHADAEEVNTRLSFLRPRKPFEDRLVYRTFRPKKEPRLVTPGGYEIEGIGLVTSQRATHSLFQSNSRALRRGDPEPFCCL